MAPFAQPRAFNAKRTFNVDFSRAQGLLQTLRSPRSRAQGSTTTLLRSYRESPILGTLGAGDKGPFDLSAPFIWPVNPRESARMPSTVNGLGTGYWGRKNSRSRRGVCRFCGREATLTSYDARLCIVVFFLPVLPIRKLRIIDDCSFCRRHWAAKRDEFEMSRQLGVSGALQQFLEQPSPDTALETHGIMLAFHEDEQAEGFRQEIVPALSKQSRTRRRLGRTARTIWPPGRGLQVVRAGLATQPRLAEGPGGPGHA